MTTFDQIRAAFPNGRMAGGEWLTYCICHDDKVHPNLSIGLKNGKLVAHCNADGRCDQESVFKAVVARLAQAGKNRPAFTLDDYAVLKKLPVDFLQSVGVSNGTWQNTPTVRFRYTLENGELAGYKHRRSANSHDARWEAHVNGWHLYGLDNATMTFPPERVFIVEGESDTDTLTYFGIPALGVSGKKNWKSEYATLKVFKDATEIFVVEEPGAEDFTAKVAASFPGKVRVIKLPVKDPSELWLQSESKEKFLASWEKAVSEAKPVEITAMWRRKFHSVDELPDGDIEFLIEDTLPKGVAFIGALSGAGKTWFCLAMARALTTGKKFLGNWRVPTTVNVLYLCPEMNDKTFKRRAVRFGIHERFYCQTISDGAPLDLYDPMLELAVKDLKPVVFLDTAIRFANGDDENSASQNAHGMAKAVFRLIHLGAPAVVCLHHRAKDAARAEEMTLENVLRGTGDLGAMCDVVWGLQYDKGTGSSQYLKDSKKLVRLEVRCVKARDFRTPEDFRIQLEPFIDDIGDMAVLTPETASIAEQGTEAEQLARLIEDNPKIEKAELERQTGVCKNRIEKLVADKGWHFDRKTKWSRNLALATAEPQLAECPL